MGFDPFRQRHTRHGDVVMVVATFAVALSLVLWAILAGR